MVVVVVEFDDVDVDVLLLLLPVILFPANSNALFPFSTHSVFTLPWLFSSLDMSYVGG